MMSDPDDYAVNARSSTTRPGNEGKEHLVSGPDRCQACEDDGDRLRESLHSGHEHEYHTFERDTVKYRTVQCQFWSRELVLPTILCVVGLLLGIAVFIFVGVETISKPTPFTAIETDTDELVLIGTAKLGWFKAVTVTTNDSDDNLDSEAVQIWLADKVATVTENITETEAVSNYAGYQNLYAYQNSTFRFEFYNLTGPPGYHVTLNIYESSNPSNQACVQTFENDIFKYLTYNCEINRTGYYDVTYLVSSNVFGNVTETLELVKLNFAFYNSSSIPSCLLGSCTLPDPPSSFANFSTQYIIAYIPSGFAPTFLILPESRKEWYTIGVAPILVGFILFAALVASYCYRYHKKEN